MITKHQKALRVLATLITLTASQAQAERVGPQGPRGLNGHQGIQGATGATGATGTIGLTGLSGTSAPVKAIGDQYQGGIVFWVDASGQHGLIAALADQSTPIQWYNGTNRLTGTTGDGIYAGAMNTTMIVATQLADTANGSFAALVAANYSVLDDGTTPCTGVATETCYGDWYLPSKVELNLLYTKKAFIGGFATSLYWSSTEYQSNGVWFQDFNGGGQSGFSKNTASNVRVRAVRAF